MFAEVAEQQPLVCIIEDAQWLDQASALTLGFVGRRLLAERVALVFAARTGVGDGVLVGLPELLVEGLGESNARALLLDNLIGPLDAAVCDQIVVESHGNPLALLEFPRTWSVGDLAGGFGLPESHRVVGKIEESYVRRFQELPLDTQLVVLAATAEPLGHPALLQTAVETLDVDMAAVDAAVDAGLLIIGQRVEFAHPLVRSSISGAGRGPGPPPRPPRSCRCHRRRDRPRPARLAPGPRHIRVRRGDCSGARTLGRPCASPRRPRCGGRFLATICRTNGRPAATWGTRHHCGGSELPGRRLRRGSLPHSSGGCRNARRVPAGWHRPASREHRLRVRTVGEAPSLLLNAAKQLESFDLELARQTYLTAWAPAFVAAGHLEGGGVFQEIRGAVQALPRSPGGSRPLDLLLDGLVILSTEGHAAATHVAGRGERARRHTGGGRSALGLDGNGAQQRRLG